MSANYNGEALIRVENLGKSFGAIHVLSGINVDIHAGDVVFVVGPSGSGKSTFLRCLNLLEEPTEGHVFLKGLISPTNTRTSTSTARKWEWCSSSSTCSPIWIL